MSKRILIANAGNARIITEAIWGLKQLKDWIPRRDSYFYNQQEERRIS